MILIYLDVAFSEKKVWRLGSGKEWNFKFPTCRTCVKCVSLTSDVFLSPQKRKRREKDDSDGVSLCSVDFKVQVVPSPPPSL